MSIMRQGLFSTRKLVRKFTPGMRPGAGLWPTRHGLRIHSSVCRSRTGETLGRIGSLEVRMARNFKEVKKAQRLRYRSLL